MISNIDSFNTKENNYNVQIKRNKFLPQKTELLSMDPKDIDI